MKRVIAKLLFIAIVSTIPINAAHAQRPAAPETLIRNATVITVTHGTLQNTDVLMRNGKIAAVGKNLSASANARVIDGTGKDRFRGDVAVKAGRIVQVGRVDDAAAKVIDAEGQIVCPGFVDPHTHYDAQITWDRLISSSAEHGITTVAMGNCGVGIAPCRPAARELLIDDLVTVEGIDKDVLQKCFEGEEGKKLLEKSLAVTNGVGFGASPTWLANNGEDKDMTLAEAVKIYATTPLQFEPGTKWQYSNMGIDTLGRIVEVRPLQ